MIYNYMFYGGLVGAFIFFILAAVCFSRTGYWVMSVFHGEKQKKEIEKQEQNGKTSEGKTDILYSREESQEFQVEYRILCVHTDESIGG